MVWLRRFNTGGPGDGDSGHPGSTDVASPSNGWGNDGCRNLSVPERSASDIGSNVGGGGGGGAAATGMPGVHNRSTYTICYDWWNWSKWSPISGAKILWWWWLRCLVMVMVQIPPAEPTIIPLDGVERWNKSNGGGNGDNA